MILGGGSMHGKVLVFGSWSLALVPWLLVLGPWLLASCSVLCSLCMNLAWPSLLVLGPRLSPGAVGPWLVAFDSSDLATHMALASPWTHAWIDSIFCCDCMLSFARRSNHGPRTNADGFKTKNQGHVSTQYSNPLQMHGCYFLLRQLCHCVAKTTTKRAMGKEPRTIARAKDM